MNSKSTLIDSRQTYIGGPTGYYWGLFTTHRTYSALVFIFLPSVHQMFSK